MNKTLFTIKDRVIPENLRWMPEVEDPKEFIKRGFIIVDKAGGMTSHDVVDDIRRIYGIRKVGHAGTLDPMVTGVLPVGLGEGTKLLRFLLESGKIYLCEMVIHKDMDADIVTKTLNEQIGTITQLPPVKSRVKRVNRERDIYSLNIRSIKGRKVMFDVHCEAGTYIRKLCHDVGEQLGIGAHMQGLQRLSAGGFKIDESISIEKLKKLKTEGDETYLNFLHPVEKMIERKPKIWIANDAAMTISQGAKLAAPGVLAFEEFEAGDFVFLFRADGFVVAVAQAEMSSEEAKTVNRGIIAKPHKIIKLT